MQRIKPLTPIIEKIDCVVLCGGRGSRLGDLTQNTPKPLLEIDGVPFLLKILRRLQQEGFRRFFLAACYLPHAFESFIRKYEKEFFDLRLILEKEPLGTGGALRNAAVQVASDPFVVLNGDTWVAQPLQPVLDQHIKEKSPFTMVVVASDKVAGGAHNKGGVEVGKNGTVVQFAGRKLQGKKFVSAGMYVVNRERALAWPSTSFDLENELELLLKPDKVFAFSSSTNLLDIGTKDCLDQARFCPPL